jgi:ribose transport system ATP-binding protein
MLSDAEATSSTADSLAGGWSETGRQRAASRSLMAERSGSTERAPPALEVRGVSKRFPGVHALDRVDLDVRRGEVHVLLGENGAGKSTLMKILSGVYSRDEGRIFIDGQEVEPRSPRHAQTLGISIIYQTFSQAPHLNVAENLFLGREPLTVWGTIDARRIHAMSREALARVGLALDPQTPIKKLSVAQRQMVEIAKALTLDAKIVIMDEPTSALTDRETRRLFQIIGALRGAGDHLHLAPPRGGRRDRRTRHGAARRPEGWQR